MVTVYYGVDKRFKVRGQFVCTSECVCVCDRRRDRKAGVPSRVRW